jgi:hypothetical protein
MLQEPLPRLAQRPLPSLQQYPQKIYCPSRELALIQWLLIPLARTLGSPVPPRKKAQFVRLSVLSSFSLLLLMGIQFGSSNGQSILDFRF